MKSNICILILVLGSAMFSEAEEVKGDLDWVVRIADAACLPGHHSEEMTKKVFSCYSMVPGTDIFHRCQNETFGHLLDTEAHMDDFCSRPADQTTYYGCSPKYFVEAGMGSEIGKAVLLLNICQANFIGIGNCDAAAKNVSSPVTPAKPVTPKPAMLGSGVVSSVYNFITKPFQG